MVLNKVKPFHRFFEEISLIPHGSGNEKALSAYLIHFAQTHALSYKQDELYNVIIYKSATPGYETHAPIILQGHMDMVCVKNPNCSFDFEHESLHLYIENGWLKAHGTTLGADDGIAAAYMLSILSASDLSHPPLECVFTVQEETTMAGAFFLNYADLHSTRMIGLDSSGEYTSLRCSSGALALHATIPFSTSPSRLPQFTLHIEGLAGGHSGKLHADSNAHHAALIGLHFLKSLLPLHHTLHLISVQGGDADNTIPREASFSFSTDIPSATLFRLFNDYFNKLKATLSTSEPALHVTLSMITSIQPHLDAVQSNLMIRTLSDMPHGIQTYHPSLADFPDVSLNMGNITTFENVVHIHYLIRFFNTEEKEKIYRNILHGINRLQGQVSQLYAYPCWEQNPDSKLENVLSHTFESIYHIPLRHKYSPGGTEYGIFSQNIPCLDIVAFGPIRENIHTPEEALDIASFDRVYQLLTTLLKNL